MRPVDLLIIYLALGSPFAVSLYLRDRRAVLPRRLLNFFYGLLAWPLLAIAMMHRLSPGKRLAAERSADLLRVRYELEQVCLTHTTTSQAFLLRESLERYVGISLAAAAPCGEATAEIFEHSEHPDPTLASRCLSRVNQRKLRYHQAEARNELLLAISTTGVKGDARGYLVRLLNELADALEDYEANQYLSDLFSEGASVHLRNAA